MNPDFTTSFPGYLLEEQLGESHHSSVYRARKQGRDGTVIFKIIKVLDPSPEQIARFKYEYRLIHRLDIDGIVKPIDFLDDDGLFAIVLEDFGGRSLKHFLKEGFGLVKFLKLAVRLAEILGALHRENISHRDIKPSNILFNPETDQVKITDFGIALEMTKFFQEVPDPNVIEGTLAYISPEQTGRMNCAVDYRTDLYSLGVTFYEMLTGRVPFNSENPMEIIHAHIAKMPQSPAEINPEVPVAVSEIIMKLLAKSAAGRYQNGFGVASDLKVCLSQLQKEQRIDPFPIGAKDISLRFIIPRQLVGRDTELSVITEAFDRVSRGGVEVVLVTGEPGIGKSALINEVHKPIVAKRGYFISGKFDQFHRAVPYSAIIQAFQSLARQILSESDKALNTWKQKLLWALGPNGKVITDVIPEIELIIGKQPDVPALGPEETQNRFRFFFKNFVRVFADRQHPLVFFLDDLQWADSASLNLIQTLAVDPNLNSLLFMGAFRNTEVAAHHPLMLTKDAIDDSGLPLHIIRLKALESEDVNQLICSFIVCNFADSQPLAEAIYAKTKGSPFFINQFLKSLYDNGHLRLNHADGWEWDIEQIQGLQATDNVVAFMAEKLHHLPEKTLKLLQIGACIGNRFELGTLVDITQQPIDGVFDAINELMRHELIIRTGSLYRFFHDRIQEAAYSLLSEEEREKIHYMIGKIDLEQTPPEKLYKRIFYICDQLNQAAPHRFDAAERLQLAELNLQAGIKAKESTAYAAAASYLVAGCNLLDQESWQKAYDLTYVLHMQQMECQYLSRNIDAAEKLFEIIKHNAATKLDMVKAYNIMIVLYVNLRSAEEAIELGIEGLKIYGISFNLRAGAGSVFLELIKARYHLKKVGLENLLDLPVVQDEELIAIYELTLYMATPAYYINPNLFALICLKVANISFKKGLLPNSSVAFVTLANILQTVFGEYRLAFRLGTIALKINEQLGVRRFAGVVRHTFAFFIQHWKKPLAANLELYPKVYEFSINAGNYVYAGHGINANTECRFLLGHHLDDILEDLEKYRDFMVHLKDPLIVSHYRELVQLIRALKGLTPVRHDLSEDDFDHEQHIRELRQSGHFFGLCLSLYTKMVLLVMFGKFKTAHETAVELEKYIKVPMGTLLIVYHHFYYALILSALWKDASPGKQGQYRSLIRKKYRKLRRWAQECPENFQDKRDLIAAELAVLEGDGNSALKRYHAAASAARKNGFLTIEAIACERLGRFYSTNNHWEEAGLFIRKAQRLYSAWGATAKALEIEESYPHLLTLEKRGGTIHSSGGTASTENACHNLDFSTVMQVSQVISGEIMLDRLLAKIMHMSIVNAGAERGYLILVEDGQLMLQASEAVDTGEKKVLQSVKMEQGQGFSPAIINYVHHSGKPLILGNASKKGPFVNDPHVALNHCKSILCMPIMNKGMLTGILYMENNLTAEAFTSERFEILRVISSQAAISIQNAQLYEVITKEISVRKEVQEAMRISEEKYRTILEEMQDVYCETDLKGHITFINPSVVTVTGLSQDELIGMSLKERLTKDQKLRIQDYYKEIYRTGNPGKPFSLQFPGKNDARVYMEIVTSPMRNEAGKIIGFRNVGRDVSERKRLEQDLLDSYKNLQTARMATILGLAKLAEYRDEDTGTHLERMREYARIIAQELSQKPKYQNYITVEYIEDIYNSAILHDIGKVGVPDAILLKPGRLTKEEFEIIKTHTTLGGDALREVESKIEGQTFLTLSREIAYSHHEKWDGSGYPKGLKNEEIPLSARIVALADVYDALTSKRVYKEAFSHEKAMEIIVKDRGTHFAPDVVDAFIANAEAFRRIRQDLNDT